MKNFIQLGRTLTLVAPYLLTSGQGALVGSVFGVAKTDIANAAEGEFEIEGCFNLTKTAGQAFAQGAKVYWDNAARSVTAVAAGNSLIGIATAAAAAGVATAPVRLNGISI